MFPPSRWPLGRPRAGCTGCPPALPPKPPQKVESTAAARPASPRRATAPDLPPSPPHPPPHSPPPCQPEDRAPVCAIQSLLIRCMSLKAAGPSAFFFGGGLEEAFPLPTLKLFGSAPHSSPPALHPRHLCFLPLPSVSLAVLVSGVAGRGASACECVRGARRVWRPTDGQGGSHSVRSGSAPALRLVGLAPVTRHLQLSGQTRI